MQSSPSVGSFTPTFNPETNCTCSSADKTCHTLYQGRVDNVHPNGWQADLSFMKATGTVMKAGTKYWISVGPATTSCTDIPGYLSVVRATGTITADTNVLSVPNVPIWKDQASYDADPPGSTKGIFIMTDGFGMQGIATWLQRDGLVFTKTCP